MNETARAKGLGELRTVTTHHVAAKPLRKGTTYLDIFVLSMERQRLEQELVSIERRRKRILNRLAEARSSMEKLMNDAQQEKAAEAFLRIKYIYGGQAEWVARGQIEGARIKLKSGEKEEARRILTTLARDYGEDRWGKEASRLLAEIR